MGFIMTAEGHLLFSIASAVFAKNAELTPVLAHGDWWHIIPSAILTCLLPDIDHPKSFLGQRLKWVSKPIARAFGHRGKSVCGSDWRKSYVYYQRGDFRRIPGRGRA